MKQLIYIFIILCFLAGLSGLGKDHESVEPELGIPLFLKIVTYDDNFNKEKYDGVAVYILYDKANTKSYEQMVNSHEYFRNHENLKIAGLDIDVIDWPIERLNELKSSLDSSKYNLLLCTDNLKQFLDDVTKICHKNNIHSFTFYPDYVNAGVSVGIRPFAKKNKILINLASAKAEGSLFSARLLKMCEIL